MLFPRVSLLVYATLAISATFASPLPYLPNYAVAEHHDSLDEPSEVEISRSNNRVARWLHGLSIVPRSSDDDPNWNDEEYVDVSPRSIAGRTVISGVGAKLETSGSGAGAGANKVLAGIGSVPTPIVTTTNLTAPDVPSSPTPSPTPNPPSDETNVNITFSDCNTCIEIGSNRNSKSNSESNSRESNFGSDGSDYCSEYDYDC